MEDKNEYKGWLNSDSILKRAFAVMGYGLLAQLIIFCVIMAIGFFFGIIGALLAIGGL